MHNRLAVPLALAVAGLLAPAAHAAPPNPFGHACAPQNGVLFCPTALDAQRVPSFDGVPLDVDVTLPPTGDGPFPTIVMMHGYGGNKKAFEATSTPRHLQQPLLRAAGLRGGELLGARIRPLVRHAGLAHEPGLRRAAGSISQTIATSRATRSTCSACWSTRAWRAPTRSA